MPKPDSGQLKIWLQLAILSRPSDLTLKIRLILRSPHTPRRSKLSRYTGWAIKLAFIGLFTLKIALPVGLIAYPTPARASILSMVSSLFVSQVEVEAANPNATSQKMPLLEAPINADVQAGSASDVHSVRSALLSDSVSLAEASTTPQAPKREVTNKVETYVVQSGDSILSIAKDFGISANTILWANNLKRDSKIKIGQKLVILPVTGLQHKVKSGDTLETIAKLYKADLDEIVAYNDIENDRIKVGDTIVVPAGELPTNAVKTETKVAATAAKSVASVALGVKTASASDTTGYYMRPISGGVRTQGIHGMNGVDLADSCGAPIYAAAAGEVVVSADDGAWNGGFGNYVVINHNNGSQTLYGHMLKVSVEAGSQVTQGQQIGFLGNTGKVNGATGCHVHFEIRNGSRNPF